MRSERLILALVVTLWGAALGRDSVDRWIDATVLPPLIHVTSGEVRDRNGTLLRAYTVDDGRWRMALSLDQVDPEFVAMLLAFEDQRFASHSGINPRAMLRAAGQALWHGRIVSGGSTLTMQVARLLEGSGTGAWVGKLRQIRVALALERRLDKDAILSMYLHLAPYGGNIEGLRAATLIWFGKEPRHLTPAQAALLVALPQAPEARRPDRFPARAQAARDRVLGRMARAGMLSAEAAQTALRDAAPQSRRSMPMLAPHLSDLAVANHVGVQNTTLDAGLQQRLEVLAMRAMAGRDPSLSLAIVVADHRSGAVLASVGSAAYGDAGQGFVDMTRAVRSPGSTLKPLVYGLAFDRGLAHPETLIRDTPATFGGYVPQNFDGIFMGEVSVADALAASRNIPVVRLTQALGPAHVFDALQRAGTTPVLPSGAPGLAISLGGLGLTLNDLVTLYAMLARGGTARPLHWDADGSQSQSPEIQILSPRSAWQVSHILAGITPPPAAGPRGRVAFKTGTSYGHRDAWAIGFDGAYVAGVWMGRPDGTPVPGAFGGSVAAPLLFEVLGRVRPDPVPLPPPPPDTLMVSNAALPLPLQRFREAGGDALPGLDLRFPPDGARLALGDGAVPVKLRGGTPPFSVLANGALVATGLRRPEFTVQLSEAGFSTLSVIDATGASGAVSIELR